MIRKVHLLVAVLASSWAAAQQPPYSWRGMDGTGVFPAKDLPTTFWDIPADFPAARLAELREKKRLALPAEAKPGTQKNVIWRTLLPFWGNNTPVVVGDRVFLLTEEGWQDEAPQLVCVDAKEGKILWRGPVDHLDAWPAAKQTEAKKLRAIEQKRWREHMYWWNRLFWDNEKNSKVVREAAEHDAIVAEARKAGWDFPKRDEVKVPQFWERGRFGRAKGGYEGGPLDPAVVAASKSCWTERIYWRQGWTSEEPWYGSTMGSVVSDGRAAYAVTALGGAAAYDFTGKRLWSSDLEYRPNKTGLACHEHYYHQNRSSPVLADDKLMSYVADMGTMYGVDVATGKLAWKTEAETGDAETGKSGQGKRRGYSGHMGPNGTPVVMRLGETTVVVSSHGMVVRVADGKYLGQVRFDPPPAGKAEVAPGDEPETGKGGPSYSSSYNSWTARGNVVYALHHLGYIYAIRLTLEKEQLRQEVLWHSAEAGSFSSVNLNVLGDHVYGELGRQGYRAIEAATGKILFTTGGAGKYATSVCATPSLALLPGEWKSGIPVHMVYRVYSLPDLKPVGVGFLAQPRPAGEVKDRWISFLGWPNQNWGAVGVTAWGNRWFMRSDDYLWCIGNPGKPYVPAEPGIKP